MGVGGIAGHPMDKGIDTQNNGCDCAVCTIMCSACGSRLIYSTLNISRVARKKLLETIML
jgi:hypothetical protein